VNGKKRKKTGRFLKGEDPGKFCVKKIQNGSKVVCKRPVLGSCSASKTQKRFLPHQQRNYRQTIEHLGEKGKVGRFRQKLVTWESWNGGLKL